MEVKSRALGHGWYEQPCPSSPAPCGRRPPVVFEGLLLSLIENLLAPGCPFAMVVDCGYSILLALLARLGKLLARNIFSSFICHCVAHSLGICIRSILGQWAHWARGVALWGLEFLAQLAAWNSEAS